MRILETEYAGHLFRSRTEARWAVFFNSLSLPYEYEKEGYDLSGVTVVDDVGLELIKRDPLPGGTWYLPDFWLPAQEIFIEVKPITYNESGDVPWPDRSKEDALEEISGHRVLTLCGIPRHVLELYQPYPAYMGFVRGDYSYYWCECPYCGSIGIQYDGRSGRNKHDPHCTGDHAQKLYNRDSLRLLTAYKAAQQARFDKKVQKRREGGHSGGNVTGI